MYPYSDKTKKMINLIGSGDAAYIPKAITCAIKALDTIAANEQLDDTTREDAAFAAANLVLSDYNDND
ncbi:YaeP family protein [Psychromonas hadalis]|uniref:YaeP family protein n=1 Tax=Psychromonas hadalis TaxID=211669 RepID=UPI0003B7BBF2|nr:YaeP family protein [Psychromonas hadalis]